jgi:hypothetical protein
LGKSPSAFLMSSVAHRPVASTGVVVPMACSAFAVAVQPAVVATTGVTASGLSASAAV